ncbi:MAG: energy transducer TonB [bacterium]|nr:energy transducer TonB [bacterium]
MRSPSNESPSVRARSAVLLLAFLLLAAHVGAAEDTRIVTPRLIEHTNARYPKPLKKNGGPDGNVTLEFRVRADGGIESPSVVGVSHAELGFEAAALDAVTRWRYEPALKDGQAIAYALRVDVPVLRSAPRARKHKFHVRGQREARDVDPVPPGSSVCVLERSNAESSFVDKVTLRKIVRLLDRAGYVTTGLATARTCMYAELGSDTRKLWEFRTGSGGPGEPSQNRAIDPDEIDRYVHRVFVTAIDAAAYRESGELKVLWQGGAIYDEMKQRNPDDPFLIGDLLLIGLFEHFGEQVNLRPKELRTDDPRAMDLREWARD